MTKYQIGFYTSCKSPIKNPDVLLYGNSDGRPADILPIIIPFLQDFTVKRGLDDTTYAGAWLVHHMIEEYIRSTAEFYKKNNIVDEVRKFIGFGITKSFNQDIDYFYRVYPNAIEVYSVRGEPFRKWILLQFISLEEDINTVLKSISIL